MRRSGQVSFQDDAFIVLEYAVAGNVGRLFALAGALFERAEYLGVVDIGVAIEGIEGAVSMTNFKDILPVAPTYPTPSIPTHDSRNGGTSQ